MDKRETKGTTNGELLLALITLFGVTLVLYLVFGARGAAALRAVQWDNGHGRYILTSSSEVVVKLDTKTGNTWVLRNIAGVPPTGSYWQEVVGSVTTPEKSFSERFHEEMNRDKNFN